MAKTATNFKEFKQEFMEAVNSGNLEIPEELKDGITDLDIASAYVVGIARANGVPALSKDELLFMIGIFAPEAMMKGESK